MTNYVSNAIHHVDFEKKITVSLEIRETVVRIKVFNTGIPIPEEDLDKVWVKFYKVDKARTREYGGSGIGLSIVKKIIEEHGGKIWATSREETGTTMYFVLRKYQEVPMYE